MLPAGSIEVTLSRVTHRMGRLERALKDIRDEADLCLNSDQNPNKGMLMRIDRIAGEALKETE